MRAVVICLGLVLLAFGSWLWLRDNGAEPAPIPPRTTQPAAPQPPAAPAAAQPATAAPAPIPAPADAAAQRSAAPTEPTRPPIPEDAKWLEVHVVDAGTTSPVADADVWWITSDTQDRLQQMPAAERRGFQWDIDQVQQRLGWHTRSDGKGTARVAANANGAMVLASADGRYAVANVGGKRVMPPEGWRIVLEADRTLRVQVVDADERPVPGVPVQIETTSRDGRIQAGRTWTSAVVTGAPDGLAEFRHIQTWLRGGDRRVPVDVAEWRAAVVLPGFADHGVAFDQAAPPAEPLVLHLAATGQLKARLLHGGRPRLEGVEFKAFRGPDEDFALQNAEQGVAADADGWARFPQVALGGELTVVARLGMASIEGTVPAPTTRGQEVQVDLSLDDLAALSGRLLGPDGQPLANGSVVALYRANGSSGSTSLETDAQGRFLWFLPKELAEKPRLDRLELTHKPANGTTLHASVEPRDLDRGTNDLGDLRLDTDPLVVAGKFVFDPPDPQRKVLFQIQRLGEPRGENGAAAWDFVPGANPTQRPDGTFEVRGKVPSGRLRLYFPGRNHLPIAPVEFQAGARDLTIPLAIGAGLDARCLLPDGVPVGQLRGVLRPNGPVPAEAPDDPRMRRTGEGRYVARCQGTSSGGAELHWPALPNGTYTLELHAAEIVAPLATIAEVVVPPPAGGDPRLRAIDLNGSVALLKVHVVGPERDGGGAGRGALVFPMPQANPVDWSGLQVPAGGLEMLVPPGPIELLVVSNDCQPRRVDRAEHEVTVTLEAWPTVELAFSGLPPLPEGVTLYAAVRPADEGTPGTGPSRHHTIFGSGGTIDGLMHPSGRPREAIDGRVTAQVGGGTYVLSAFLRRQDGRKAEPLRSISPQQIVGGPTPAPIAVQLSEDEIRQALAKLQAPPPK